MARRGGNRAGPLRNAGASVFLIASVAPPLLLPGIRLQTSPADLHPIKRMRLVRFNGARHVLFGV